MLMRDTHAYTKGHPEKHDASEGRHGLPKREEPSSARVEFVYVPRTKVIILVRIREFQAIDTFQNRFRFLAEPL